jgi:heme A synthase
VFHPQSECELLLLAKTRADLADELCTFIRSRHPYEVPEIIVTPITGGLPEYLQWIADSVTAMQPFWLNFVEGLGGVQFVHRYLAYVVVGLVVFLFFKGRGLELASRQMQSLKILLLVVSAQFVLGVVTLLYAVPISLGVLHQLGAFVLLGSVVYALHAFRLKVA